MKYFIRILALVLIIIAIFFSWNSGSMIYDKLTIDLSKPGSPTFKFPIWVGYLILIISVSLLIQGVKILRRGRIHRNSLILIILLILIGIGTYFTSSNF